jgi:hypothetical protein
MWRQINNPRIRIPTRQIHVHNICQELSEQLFDLCTKRDCLHVNLNHICFFNKLLGLIDCREIRNTMKAECIWYLHENNLYNVKEEDFENKMFLDSIKECYIELFPSIGEARIFLNFGVTDSLNPSSTTHIKHRPKIKIRHNKSDSRPDVGGRDSAARNYMCFNDDNAIHMKQPEDTTRIKYFKPPFI